MALNESFIRGSASVSTTPTTIFPLIDDMLFERKVFSITNISTSGQVIYIAFAEDAVVGTGQPIYPGGTYIESRNEGFIPTNERVSVISSASGGIVSVMMRTAPIRGR